MLYPWILSSAKKYSVAIFFLLGFIFDIVTLDKADDWFNIIQQLFYLSISFTIFFLRFSNKKLIKFDLYQEEIFHFCIGSLMSCYTIFFFKSSSLINSIYFLSFCSFLLIANEFKVIKDQKLISKSIFLSVCLLFFLSNFFSLIFNSISNYIFYCSLFISFLLMYLFFNYFKNKFNSRKFFLKTILYPSQIILITLLFFYIFKLIPPVPLTLNYSGIFSKVEKVGSNYLLYHNKPWWNFWHHGDENFKPKQGQKVFFYTQVYAPSNMKLTIHTQFERLDDQRVWIKTDKIPMSIKGGRHEGFRAYVTKSNYEPGKWRVLVLTNDDREIGRHYFSISPNEDENTETSKPMKIIKK